MSLLHTGLAGLHFFLQTVNATIQYRNMVTEKHPCESSSSSYGQCSWDIIAAAAQSWLVLEETFWRNKHPESH